MLNFDIFSKDPDIVKKLLIGSVLAMTGIGFIPLAGWRLEHIRRSIEEDNPLLPDWDDFGKFITDGLKMIGFNLVWYLPIILLVILVSVAVVFASFSFASEDDMVLFIVATNFCVVGAALVYTIPAVLLSMPAYGTLATTGSVKEALNVKKAFQLFKQNTSGFLIAGLLSYFVLSILGSIGTILCLVGIYPAYVVGYGLTAQLYGRAYKEGVLKMEQHGERGGFEEEKT